MKIRVADYIAKTLAAHGIRHVFMVTGGGAMHLNDAFGRCKEMQYICCHHEQACAMAAESYFRLSGKLAAVNVTTGPGGINALNGVFGAHTDSLGMVVISGQVKFETTIKSTTVPLRQLGDQEADIVRMAEGVTKYAVMVTEPESIRYHLEKALFLATEGRPGPVWLDIPMNVQGALIDEETLEGFTAPESVGADVGIADVSPVLAGGGTAGRDQQHQGGDEEHDSGGGEHGGPAAGDDGIHGDFDLGVEGRWGKSSVVAPRASATVAQNTLKVNRWFGGGRSR